MTEFGAIRDGDGAGTHPAGRVEWAVAPYRERPARTAAVVAVIAAVAALVQVLFGDPFLAGLSAALLAGSLAPFFGRTHFVLDEAGVEWRRGRARSRRPWSDFRSHYADARGVTLSPYTGASWLEPYRGVRLLFGGNGGDVLRFVASRVPEGPRRERSWSFLRRTRR